MNITAQVHFLIFCYVVFMSSVSVLFAILLLKYHMQNNELLWRISVPSHMKVNTRVRQNQEKVSKEL
jgi:hypothetical protein